MPPDGTVLATLQARLEEVEAQITAEEARLRERIAPLHDERAKIKQMLRIYDRVVASPTDGRRGRNRPPRPSDDRKAANSLRQSLIAYLGEHGHTSPQSAMRGWQVADAFGLDRQQVGSVLGAAVRWGHGVQRVEQGGDTAFYVVDGAGGEPARDDDDA